MDPATKASALVIRVGWVPTAPTNVVLMTVLETASAFLASATVNLGFLVLIAVMLSALTIAPVTESAWGDGASASPVTCRDL